MFKAAVISSFISTTDEMTMFNVKSVACSDEAAKNYHLSEFPSVLQSCLAPLGFSSISFPAAGSC